MKGYMTADEVIEMLREIALRGERCPGTKELRDMAKLRGYKGISASGNPVELAHTGRIRIEIYQQNYRVIQIGNLRTKECPHRVRPLRVVHATPKRVRALERDTAGREAALALPTRRD